MRSARLIVAVLAVALLAPAAAQAKSGRVVEPCEGRNFGGAFPSAYSDVGRNIVVGPLVLAGGNSHTDLSPASINRFGGDKLAVLLLANRTASVRISKALRPTAAGYVAAPLSEANFAAGGGTRKLLFKSCPPETPRTNVVENRRVTFWMNWISVVAPVCVYLNIRINGGPVRKRTMSMGAGACPQR
jgi:hypothetical protein